MPAGWMGGQMDGWKEEVSKCQIHREREREREREKESKKDKLQRQTDEVDTDRVMCVEFG